VRRVIAAIDNSAAARPVLAMAKAIASDLGGELDVLHVVEDGDETLVLRQRSQARPCARFRVIQLSSLQRWSRGGCRGSGPWSPRWRRRPRPAGHLALTLAGRTDKPVIVVPPGAEPPGQVRRVLIAMAGTPGKARALQRTIELSSSANFEIVVVHVDEEIPSFTDQVQHETRHTPRSSLPDTSWARPSAARDAYGCSGQRGARRRRIAQADLVAVGWPHTTEPGRGAVARKYLTGVRCRSSSSP